MAPRPRVSPSTCVEDGVGYTLAGSLREQLLALAESIYHQQPGAK